MEKKIEICIGTNRDRSLRARLSLLVIDSGRIMSEAYHSIQIPAGTSDQDLAAIRAANEAHLADPDGGIPWAPWPAIPEDEWSDVKSHLSILQRKNGDI